MGKDTERGTRRVLSDYGERSTIHGIRYVLSPAYSTWRRVIWGIIVLLAAAVLVYTMAILVMHYRNFPVETQYSLLDTSALMTPRVYVCSQNPLSLTALVSSGKYDEAVAGFKQSNTWVGSAAVLGDNLTANIKQAGPKVNDTILRVTSTIDGATLHSLQPMLSALGPCFMVPQLKVKEVGVAGGLTLLLNTASYDTVSDINGQGALQVFLDEAPISLQRAEDGITLNPGMHTKMYLSLTTTHRLGPPYGGCMQRTEPCQGVCLLHSVQDNCGCRPFYLEALDGYHDLSLCRTPSQLRCAAAVRKSTVVCHCPTPCFESRYAVRERVEAMASEITLQRTLSDVTLRMLRQQHEAAQNATEVVGLPPLDAPSVRATLTMLSVGFDQMTVTDISQTPAFDVSDLMLKIGIYLAVFVGASVISLFELIDLIVVAIYACCTKRNQT